MGEMQPSDFIWGKYASEDTAASNPVHYVGQNNAIQKEGYVFFKEGKTNLVSP